MLLSPDSGVRFIICPVATFSPPPAGLSEISNSLSFGFVAILKLCYYREFIFEHSLCGVSISSHVDS